MTKIIIGNIFALVGSLLMVYIGLIKKKKKILLYQLVELTLFAIANFTLGGYPGLIINLLNIVNVSLCYKKKLNYVWKIIISVVAITLIVIFNNLGLIGYLPLLAFLLYLWFITEKDIIKFKVLNIIILVMWLVYDFMIKAYVGCAFDLFTIITNIIAIVFIKKNRKKK